MVVLVCIGIAAAKPRDDQVGDITEKEFLEDILSVMNDNEKRGRCVNRKSRSWCKTRELFFHSCKQKVMRKYCRSTCRLC
ncbi:hypothetical protein ACROYT_G022285 [Oculina patagonica]